MTAVVILTAPARHLDQNDVTVRGGPRRWTPGRVVAVIAGTVLVLIGLGLGTAGVTALVADRGLREDGLVVLAREDVSTGGYGVVLGDLVLDAGSAVPAAMIGELRLQVSPGVGEGPLFVGVARSSDVETYLGRSTSPVRQGDPQRRMMPWTLHEQQPAAPPGDLDIWAASASGSGTQEITWAPRSGEWSFVVMQRDASIGVDADVEAAATLPWLDDVGPWLLASSLVALAAGGLLIGLAGRRASASTSGRRSRSQDRQGVRTR